MQPETPKNRQAATFTAIVAFALLYPFFTVVPPLLFPPEVLIPTDAETK